MVSDINAMPVSSVTSTSIPPSDNNNEVDTNTDTQSFTEALSKAESKNKTEKKDNKVPSTDSPKPQNTQESSEDSIDESHDSNIATDSTQSILTKKPSEKDSKSPLSKALNGEDIDPETESDKSPNIKDKNAKDTKDKDVKIPNMANVNSITESGTSDDSIIEDTEDIKAKDKKEIPNQKKLSDIKNEADKKNLGLQKIEVIDKGGKNQINPQDLMDKNLVVENKERLSNSLQNMGASVANSLSKAMPNQDDEKDKLLAELLNKYDASENAKRKAENDAEKLRFKVDNGNKAMVIDRGVNQPADIINSKFRNEAMQTDFLEQLQGITGDEDLNDALLEHKTKLEIMRYLMKMPESKDTKPYQSLIAAGQNSLDLGNLKLFDNQIGNFEMNTQKPFDELISSTVKNDKPKEKSDIDMPKEDKKDDKPKEKVEGKQEVAVQAKQEVSMKNALAREAMKNFASQLRNEVLNYKPPVTKLNLELNPESLGQVSMTISKKGNDLKVSITSNANVMTMFVQNAQELRQNLMQIGFNNLDLNFSSRDSGGGDSGGGNASESNKDNQNLKSIEEAQSSEEIPQSLEITLPDYA